MEKPIPFKGKSIKSTNTFLPWIVQMHDFCVKISLLVFCTERKTNQIFFDAPFLFLCHNQTVFHSDDDDGKLGWFYFIASLSKFHIIVS